MQQDKQSSKNKCFASNALAVALLIICAVIGMLFYGQHIMATATQGMGKLAAKHLTYEIPNALILLEARRGPCATIPITSEELMKRGAPKQTANGSPWTASFTGESVEVIYPYSDEDDYRMTKHDLLKVIQESSNVQKAEIAVEGVKVTYSCQHPVTKS